MLFLPHSCRCSEPKVTPSTWQRSNASTKTDWFIWYRFHDPSFRDKFPKGKLVKIRGMNSFKDRRERQDAVRVMMEDLLDALQRQGWNPITEMFVQVEGLQYEIDPSTPAADAIVRGIEFIKALEHNTKLEIERIVRHFNKAMAELRFDRLPLYELKRKHVRFALDRLEKTSKYWSAHIFNNYRRYLSMVFSQLEELEAIEYNPVRGIKKMTPPRKIRKLLTEAERRKVDAHLYKNHYAFWRYMQIFFHSGARTTEMMRLQAKHVDLERQEVIYLVKKGRGHAEVIRPIKNIALPWWRELLEKCRPDDFLFSSNLEPGATSIRPDQIKRRWRVHVKEKLGIQVDFYPLKHLNSDQIATQLDLEHAARMNGHSDTTMVKKHYAVNESQRQMERLKRIDNPF